jgi:hypothetical protein
MTSPGTVSSTADKDGNGMTEWNPEVARLRQRLARIALAPGTPQARAEELLHVLGRILPCDAAWLAVRDPERRRHVPLALAGAAEPLRRYFSTDEADDEVEQLGLNRHRPPMLASEIPVPLPELRAWGEHLLPAGFRGGVAAGLFTPSGRHVGFLSLLTGDPARLRPADRDLIAAISPVIAHALDRTREIADSARIVEAARAGIVLTRGGDALPLPGLPDHRLLTPGSAVLTAAARELADSDTYVTFLAPPPSPDEPLVRVTALSCARPEIDHLQGVVLLSPPGDLRGLHSLHLRLLGLMAEGAHVPAMAAALGTDERTVADAVRVALLALATSDLTAAAVRAVRTGLRIPPQLNRVS